MPMGIDAAETPASSAELLIWAVEAASFSMKLKLLEEEAIEERLRSPSQLTLLTFSSLN